MGGKVLESDRLALHHSGIAGSCDGGGLRRLKELEHTGFFEVCGGFKAGGGGAGAKGGDGNAVGAKLRADSMKLCDRVMRAKGILSNALLMPREEFTRLWSDLRLGAVIGLPGLPSPEELGSILMAALLCPPEKGDPEAARAMLLKRRLSSCRNACRV